MDYQPKKFITRILEYAAVFALSAFLLKLGVSYIVKIWPVLLIIVLVIAAGIVLYKLWNRTRWR